MAGNYVDHRSCLRVLPRPSCLALLKMWKSNQARYLVVLSAVCNALHNLSVDKILKLMVTFLKVTLAMIEGVMMVDLMVLLVIFYFSAIACRTLLMLTGAVSFRT